MKNTTFKKKAIQLTIPLVATTALVYADNSSLNYTRGNYIIIGANSGTSNSVIPNVSVSSGSTSYHMYRPGQEVNPFQNYNPPQWNLYNSLMSSLGNLAFGAGSGLYQMSLSNPTNLAGIFGEVATPNEFGQLFLPAALYAVGTYAPVLKEALVGADNISKQMTMFSTQAINSVQNAINSLPSGEKQAVQACVTYNLTGGQQFTGLSQEAITRYLSNTSQSAFNSLVDNCMQGESIAQTFNYNSKSINEYLDQFNSRAWMQDDINQEEQNGLMYKGSHSNLNAVDTLSNTSSNLYSLFDPKLVAKDMLIATLPKVHYERSPASSSSGIVVPQFVYITIPPSSSGSSSSKLLVSFANFNQDIKTIVKIQMNTTLMSLTNATSFSAYYNQYVVPVNNALSLTGNDLYNYWYILYNAIQSYAYALQNGVLPPPNDGDIITQKDLNNLHAQIILARKTLTDLYIAYFKKETLNYLGQETQQNEQKYKAEHDMNNKPAPPPKPANQNA